MKTRDGKGSQFSPMPWDDLEESDDLEPVGDDDRLPARTGRPNRVAALERGRTKRRTRHAHRDDL
jgi:hypothetical protein